MMASIGPIITILGSVFLVLFKAWQDKKPERTQEDRNDEVDQGRKALDSGDVGAIERRNDQLLRDGTGGSPTGCESAEDVERRLSQL